MASKTASNIAGSRDSGGRTQVIVQLKKHLTAQLPDSIDSALTEIVREVLYRPLNDFVPVIAAVMQRVVARLAHDHAVWQVALSTLLKVSDVVSVCSFAKLVTCATGLTEMFDAFAATCTSVALANERLLFGGLTEFMIAGHSFDPPCG